MPILDVVKTAGEWAHFGPVWILLLVLVLGLLWILREVTRGFRTTVKENTAAITTLRSTFLNRRWIQCRVTKCPIAGEVPEGEE